MLIQLVIVLPPPHLLLPQTAPSEQVLTPSSQFLRPWKKRLSPAWLSSLFTFHIQIPQQILPALPAQYGQNPTASIPSLAKSTVGPLLLKTEIRSPHSPVQTSNHSQDKKTESWQYPTRHCVVWPRDCSLTSPSSLPHPRLSSHTSLLYHLFTRFTHAPASGLLHLLFLQLRALFSVTLSL